MSRSARYQKTTQEISETQTNVRHTRKRNRERSVKAERLSFPQSDAGREPTVLNRTPALVIHRLMGGRGWTATARNPGASFVQPRPPDPSKQHCRSTSVFRLTISTAESALQEHNSRTSIPRWSNELRHVYPARHSASSSPPAFSRHRANQASVASDDSQRNNGRRETEGTLFRAFGRSAFESHA